MKSIPWRIALAVASVGLTFYIAGSAAAARSANTMPSTALDRAKLSKPRVEFDMPKVAADLRLDSLREASFHRVHNGPELHELVHASLDFILNNNASSYSDYVSRAGGHFDANQINALAQQWQEWGLLERPLPRDFASQVATQSDAALRDLAALSAQRRFAWIQSVTPGSLRVTQQSIGTDGSNPDWPYKAFRGMLSVFIGPEGRLTKATQASIVNTPRFVHVIVAVEFGDGSPGHIALICYNDPAINHWLPAEVIISSEGRDWPFPLW